MNDKRSPATHAGTFITAIGTPLTEDEQLHEQGLEIELADQWGAGIDGILVAGSMGAMQLLTDATYRRLISRSVDLSAGRGEILVGAGDAGFARTRDRIRLLNEFAIDGVAVLAPYFWTFGQDELIDYYRALADEARAPLYLYDLPQVTGTKLTTETVLTLAEHPNIRGIKASAQPAFSRQLIDRVDASFRVIVAEPDLVDVLLHHGIDNHLDGMWAVAPQWIVAIGRCAAEGDWPGAAAYQQQLSQLRDLIVQGRLAVFTELMNARGIPGRFAPLPFRPLDAARRERLLDEPVLRKLVRDCPAGTG